MIDKRVIHRLEFQKHPILNLRTLTSGWREFPYRGWDAETDMYPYLNNSWTRSKFESETGGDGGKEM
jgi:hypothetical protein